MKISIRAQDIYASGVLIYDFTGDDIDEMNADLLAKITKLRQTDKGEHRTNSPRVDSWHSTEPLHAMDEFASFKAFANEQLFHAGNYFGFRKNPVVTAMWSIVLPKMGSNKPHIHPGAHATGVYYLQAPTACGDLVLVDPRGATQPYPAEFRNDSQGTKFRYHETHIEAKVGRMVICPGWIMHYVDTNMAGKERVVLAFNAAHAFTKRGDRKS